MTETLGMLTRYRVIGVSICLAAFLTGCGQGEQAGGGAVETDARASNGSAATPPAQSAMPVAAPEPKTVADLFPAGAGRELVLNNCSTCHNVACSVIGQRTADRWAALKAAHKDRLTDVDLDAIFSYLQTNFDDSKPEPKVPPAFLEGGCTPF